MKEITSRTIAVGDTSTTISPGQESSVEIAQNAKGEARITVKCYHADLSEAAQQAMATYCYLKNQIS